MAGKRGAPVGNNNAGKSKDWEAAIRRALGKNRLALERCAMALVRAAEGGDMQALKELGDRLDGKPKQDVGIEASLTVRGRVSAEPMTVEAWQADALSDQPTYQ